MPAIDARTKLSISQHPPGVRVHKIIIIIINYLNEQHNNIISTNFQPKQLNPSALYHELCTQQTKDQTPSNSNILSQSSRLVSSSSLLSNYELPKLQFGRKFSLVVRKSEIPKEHAYATKINQSQSPSQ